MAATLVTVWRRGRAPSGVAVSDLSLGGAVVTARPYVRGVTEPTSWATTPATRATMMANRSRDTGPELTLRRLLHARGLRYRVAYRPVPSLRRTADVAFTKARVAVFVDGCFWHGCQEHHRLPTANREYWRAKVARNRARDVDTTSALEQQGWLVLRFWEHEAPSSMADLVETTVRDRRGQRASQPPEDPARRP